MARLERWIVLMVLSICSCFPAAASHIVGGEFQYINESQWVGPDSVRYRIIFKLYMDCSNPAPGAIQMEDTGRFTIFSGDKTWSLTGFVRKDTTLFLAANFQNECIKDPPPTCLLQNTYEFTIALPNRPDGYYIVQNNCCRNESVVNILNPGTTGASYYTFLPQRSVPNNSAYFTNIPPQIICVNVPFTYNHSAIDPDGDSLSYELNTAFAAQIGGGNQPIPSPPPFPPVTYIAGFTAKEPIGGNPLLSIDPNGIIKGTPDMQGRFVVAVYCHEWRDEKIINTVIREYQFVVTNCSKAVVANIPQYSDEFNTYIVECKSNTVRFDNLSTGGNSYFWDFGVPSLLNDTSVAFSPTFTYPDTGTYEVKLIVNKGTTCTDSISRLVKVYPSFTGYFTYTGLPCPGSLIQFRDSSISTTKYLTNYWSWDFGDGTTSLEENPTHVYPEGGTYPVVLVSKNARGCIDTVREDVFIEKFRPFAGNDTIIVKGEIINFNAQGGGSYVWTPSTNLNNPFVGDPVGSYPDTGRFTYVVDIVSPYQCVGADTISILVVNQGALFVPSAFSPNGDGNNDVLRPIGIGYRNIRFFRVFNRWGEQVFYTTKFGEGWDGNWKGKASDIGTYFWVLGVVDRFGQDVQVSGDALLLR